MLYLIKASYTDIRKRRISVWEVAAIALILFLLALIGGCMEKERLYSMIPGLIILFVAYVTNEQIGYGDGLIFLLVGMHTSIMELMGILLLSLFFCTILSIGLLILKKCEKRASLPFIPFITGAYLVRMVSGWM
ncbi:MAG: prepilin peptidase [Lachnospiraceae bacterium]|nr:prepilin peptidase [Lachnospiraceae bacterium]